jgi:hypothetical protein
MTERPNCNNTVDIINQKIFTRNIASGNLDVLLSPRPNPTKYVSPFPNTYPPCRKHILHYTTTQTFNPGSGLGAWSGFATNINDESILRNQIHAIQKYPQAPYVPNSDSDLYNSTIPLSVNHNTVELKYPHLFNSHLIEPKNLTNSENLGNSNKQVGNLQNLGNSLFNNDTRQQLKDS